MTLNSAIHYKSRNLAAYVSSERSLHALLLWGLALDLYSDRKLSVHELHLKEFLSDVASSNFCSLAGLYKPAMMSLRSGVENFVKSMLLLNKADIDDTKSIYVLNDRFRDIFKNKD